MQQSSNCNPNTTNDPLPEFIKTPMTIGVFLFCSLKYFYYICKRMETIQVTYQEIKMATRPNVYRNKKRYTRKSKHKNQQYK